MYFLYSLLLTVGFIALLPRFAIDALRTRKYVTGLRQRLGSLPRVPASDQPLIWLHCVSVGETEAARPLVRALRERFPSYRLVVSTTTVTGQQIAQRVFRQEAAAIFYFPIDWAWTVRRVLGALKPSAVLIMETELWPNLLRACRRQSIPVALVNGRISPTSFRRYQMIQLFTRRMLNNLSMAIMQSERDVSRIRELGMPGERTLSSGNLKFDSANSTGSDGAITSDIRGRFRFNHTESLIVAASTHWPEEQVLIDAFKRIKQYEHHKRVRLLIAPRHPERFSEVADLISTSGLSWARRTTRPVADDASCDVILLDSIGELRAVFPLADIAFIGGSIASHGGQNVLEPAVEGVCVVTGPHTENFAAIIKTFLSEGALVQLEEVPISEAANQLAATIRDLLEDESRRGEIGRRAMTVCDQNRGATDRTIQILAKLLSSRSSVNESVPFSAIHVTAAK
jgi:3-deoxy-D-manno-octulosonic-acid transferase